MRVSEETERKELFETIWVRTSAWLILDIRKYSSGSSENTKKIHARKTTCKHRILKLQKIRQKSPKETGGEEETLYQERNKDKNYILLLRTMKWKEWSEIFVLKKKLTILYLWTYPSKVNKKANKTWGTLALELHWETC